MFKANVVAFIGYFGENDFDSRNEAHMEDMYEF